MLKIIFTILWLISLLIWNIYAIKTIIEIRNNGNYIEYCLKMNMALALMIFFNVLMKIF